jgi:lipoyl(octanoyl) transferase
MKSPEVSVIDLGLIPYEQAWKFQEKLFNQVVEEKLKLRSSGLNADAPTQHYLLFCEHPHVYTIGKSGDENNLVIEEKKLQEIQAEFFKTNRGGDITYHGPGQMVMYPIFNLDNFFTDIHKYLRYLEEAVILTLSEYGIKAGRIDGLTGVWLDADNPAKNRKICAMGVKCSRWVTMHGIGFNINTDLSYFQNIIPCGINDKPVTSLARELGRQINMEEIKEKLILNLANIFDFNIVIQEKA